LGDKIKEAGWEGYVAYMAETDVYVNSKNLKRRRPYHSSGSQSLASNHGSLGSIPGQIMLDLWWKKWHCGMTSPSTLVYHINSQSIKCSTLINKPIIDAI
jgi:hypothetical protein